MTSLFGSSPRALRGKIFARSVLRKLSGAEFNVLPTPHVVRPRELVACQPALFETEQLNRVRSSAFTSTLYDEVAKLTTTQFIEAPLERYDLGPAVIAGGRIYREDATHFFSAHSPHKAIQGELTELGDVHLVTSEQGINYFGHWLRDDCTLYELLREDGIEPWALRRPDWPDARLYEQAFGQDWPTLDFARIANLTAYREQRFNRDKARRILALRARLRAAHPGRKGGQIVYLSRGSMGSPRNMSNAAEFEAAMEAAGIQVVAPGSDPETLLAALLDARMIITIEGSQAAHGVYMLGDGGAMLILQSPDRFYNPHHEWARLIGMGYGTIIGTPDEVSFHMNPSEVLAMADRLEASPRLTDL